MFINDTINIHLNLYGLHSIIGQDLKEDILIRGFILCRVRLLLLVKVIGIILQAILIKRI